MWLTNSGAVQPRWGLGPHIALPKSGFWIEWAWRQNGSGMPSGLTGVEAETWLGEPWQGCVCGCPSPRRWEKGLWDPMGPCLPCAASSLPFFRKWKLLRSWRDLPGNSAGPQLQKAEIHPVGCPGFDCCEFTEHPNPTLLSQNHRIVGVWKGPLWVTQSNPLLKQGHPEQAAQDVVQAGLEYLQRRRLHSLPGQPGPGLRHPQREEVLPHVQTEHEEVAFPTAAFAIAHAAALAFPSFLRRTPETLSQHACARYAYWERSSSVMILLDLISLFFPPLTSHPKDRTLQSERGFCG